MKRVLFILILWLAFKLSLFAQAYDGKIEYQKTLQPAAVIEWPYSEGIVEEAIKSYMGKRGCKQTSVNGFQIFKATKLDSGETDPSDFYFKIERKSRKEKDFTIVSLLPTKANEPVINRPPEESPRIEEAKLFLNNMGPYIEAYDLGVLISDQEAVVKKAQKKYDNLLNDQSDLDKGVRKLKADLEQNRIDQQKENNLMIDPRLQDASTQGRQHKKMGRLLQQQGDLEKKLSKTQQALDQTEKKAVEQKQRLEDQQKLLDAMKAKQKP